MEGNVNGVSQHSLLKRPDHLEKRSVPLGLEVLLGLTFIGSGQLSPGHSKVPIHHLLAVIGFGV